MKFPNSRGVVAFAVSLLLLVSALVLLPNLVPNPIAPPNRGGLNESAAPGVYFDQFVIVLMENHDLCDIYTHCGGSATYMTGLADAYSMSLHWESITNPSQPNYIALIGGSTFGVQGDGNHPNLNQPTIVDILSNTGRTWRAIAEDASGSGCGISPPRGEDHFPFLSYTTITSNATRCANLVAGSTQAVIDSFNAGVEYTWFTPNDCNNMHSCSIATGDSWVGSWVPDLLSAMAGKRAAMLLTYDEGYANPPLTYSGFSGPATRAGYTSTASYTHYSMIKLIEDNWGGGNLGQGDVNAPSPSEFFAPVGPDFTIAANPSSVSFLAGTSATSTITVTSLGGFTGTVGLTTASVPSGVSTTCVPASISGGSGTSTCTLSSSAPGAYTVTVTGTSGTLVHRADIAVQVTAPGPTARFTYSPAFPEVNESITFDASSSSDTDPGATLQARWDWEGDGGWDTGFSSALTAAHTYATAGTYPVKLEIQDSNGLSDTVSQSVVVSPIGGGGVGAPPGYGLIDPSRLQARGPIYIGSNAAFTAANGVRSGTGTAADPYVISDWYIDGNLYTGTQALIHVESTDAYLVIENNKITNLSGTNQWEAIQLGHWPATILTQHVTIRHNHVENARHAYGIAVRQGSSDVHVEANYVRTDANFDWVFGIATDRGVNGVTIYGNFVDAYTSGTFHTSGIHISDTHIDDAQRATGVLATRNTVVNATAGGIVSLSSTGTLIGWNLVYSDYPGLKTVDTNYPRGIMTEQNSDATSIVGNVIHMFHWGIQVGSDRGRVASNTVTDVDSAVYVPDTGAWPGVSNVDETIYDTTYSNVATTAIRLPSVFQGTAVDLGPGIQTTDFSPVLFVTSGTPTAIAYAWSGTTLNVTITVGGITLFDTVSTTESQAVRAAWTGSLSGFVLTTLRPGRVAFQLQSPVAVAFVGAGFAPNAMYNLNRTDTGGTTTVLTAASTPNGDLAFTIPAAAPSTYGLVPENVNDTTAPVTASILSGAAGTGNWYHSAVSITLTATDDLSGVQSIQVRTDGGAWQTYASPVPVQGEGTHTVDYYATDFSGNAEAVRSVTLRIDLGLPSTLLQIAGTLAGDGSYLASVTVTLTGTDSLSGVALVQYRIDLGAWRTFAGPFLLSGNGTHTIDYATTDVAGNVEPMKSSVVRISGSAFASPATVADLVGTFGLNNWYISFVNVTMTATSPSGAATSIMYSLDGIIWFFYSQRFMIPEGAHTLTWQASDAAGYFEPVQSAPASVDVTRPSIDSLAPSGQVTDPNMPVSWTGSDSASGIARYEISIDGGAFEPVGTSTSVSRHWNDGAHHVRVKAFDNAGHENVADTDFTVQATGVFFPGPLQAIPVYFPAMGLGLLAFSYLLIRHHRKKEQRRHPASDRGDSDLDDLEDDEPPYQ